MSTTFYEVVEGRFGGGASHRQQAVHLEIVLFVYQAVHIVLQAGYIYQGKLDDYDVHVPWFALLFCSRRVVSHFTSSRDPLDLGPHCWLLLRVLVISAVSANCMYHVVSLVHRHSSYAFLCVVTGAVLPFMSIFGYAPRRALARQSTLRPHTVRLPCAAAWARLTGSRTRLQRRSSARSSPPTTSATCPSSSPRASSCPGS